MPIEATCYSTDAFAEAASSHDPKPFFLAHKANFDPEKPKTLYPVPDILHNLLYTSAKPSAIQRLAFEPVADGV